MYKVLWYSPLGERGNRPIIKESSMDIERAILAARASRVDTVIEKAKAFAESNYDQGYDFFVECYGDSEWDTFVTRDCGTLKTWDEVKKDMGARAECYALKFSESGCDW